MGWKNIKGTQKVNPIIDASIESPPYETALGMSNTEEVKRGKQDKQVGYNSCFCKKYSNIRPTRTWESITNLYGDVDTTEVWDSQQHNPKTFFSPKLSIKENRKAIIDKSENNKVAMYPTSTLKSTPAKLSLIGLYRKHKRNQIKAGPHANANSMDVHVKSSPYPEPKVKFLFEKPKKIKNNYATGDILTEDPAREALEKVKYLHDLKYTPYKRDKITFPPITLKNHHLQDSFIGKIIGNTISKCKNNNETTLEILNTVNNDNRKQEKYKTKTSTKESKIMKKSKNKKAKSMKTEEEYGNVGYGDQISPIPLKKQNLQDLQSKYSFIGKMMGHTICKCKNNNESTFQTSSNVNNDNSKKEKNNTKTFTIDNKIIKKSMKKQAKAMKMDEQDGNVEYGNNILPSPIKKQDLQELQCKSSLIDKINGHLICKCKNNKEITLQPFSNLNNDNSKKEKNNTNNPIKENKIMKKSKNKQVKAKKTEKKVGNVGYGDQISPIPLTKQDLQDLQFKSSFIGKMMGHTICKSKNNNGSLFQTSSNVNNDNSKKENNDNSKKEKNNTKTPTKENKIKKTSKNKQSKTKNMKEEDGNVGYGAQISPIPFKKQNCQNLQCKCSFFGKMMGHTICKCKSINGSTLQTSRNVNDTPIDPLLEMKVNLKDMRVINSSEVDKKVSKFGRTEKNMSCVCPSKRLDNDRVCKRGPCEQAFENQHTFDCKCRKQNIIECKDSTCDLKFRDIKVRSRKKKNPQSPVYTKDKKPLFEVMLDPTDMKIINSNELKHIIRNSSENNVICPTGICNTMSKKRNIQLNCKCVGKKLSPIVDECEERTCRNPEKKGKISCLCSRVFSKSENWTGQKENSMKRPIRGNRYGTNIRRNGIMINLPRGRTPKKGSYVGETLSDVWCKCFCECNTKKPEKTLIKKNTIKKINKKRRRRRKGLFRKKKIDHRTLKEKFLDCLEREQENCEKKVKQKSKEYQKTEKKVIKENKKIEAEQKHDFAMKKYDLNCLTSVIVGILNVGLESIKTVLKIAVSVIGDPISSYVYVKEKIKNPPAAIIRMIEWFIRTWRNKTSVVAKALDESAALNVIADQLESSAVYNTLTSQGRTPEEKMLYERRLRKRKRRMQKRQDEAIYGCRHVLLMTMRKTPCIWFYHICPELYPQCLSLTQFMTNFLHIILFCGAIMCWTPCIVVCEMFRAFLCCCLCTN